MGVGDTTKLFLLKMVNLMLYLMLNTSNTFFLRDSSNPEEGHANPYLLPPSGACRRGLGSVALGRRRS